MRPISITVLLIKYGARVDIADSLGQTPLHLAAVSVNPELCDFRLAAGASLSSRDRVGRTPLHAAAEKGNSDIARMLLEHDRASLFININAEADDGTTALHVAAMSVYYTSGMIPLLLE